MAAIFNFEIDQGATHQDRVEITDEAGNVIDLTGYVARMNFGRTLEDPTPEIALTSSPAAGLTITAASGWIDIVIEAEVTAGLTQSYIYDLHIEDSEGLITRIIQGVATINRKVQET